MSIKEFENAAWDNAESHEQRYSSAPMPAISDKYSLRDRLDILNLLSLYGHLFDGGYRTAWLETIFAPHVVWTLAPQPALGRDTISIMRGREEVKNWFRETPRAYLIYVEKQGLDQDGASVFHSVRDIGITEQKPASASIVANQFIGVRHPGLTPTFHQLAVVGIEGELEKNAAGQWQVVNWNIQ